MIGSDVVEAEERLATMLRMAPIDLRSKPSLSAEFDFNYEEIELTRSDTISCVRWHGVYYMIGIDVARTLAFRLSMRGMITPQLRFLKRNVFSRLRAIKEGQGMLLEPANVGTTIRASLALAISFAHQPCFLQRSRDS